MKKSDLEAMIEIDKMINMTNIFGDYRKSVSIPVYKNSKAVFVNRYSMVGSAFLKIRNRRDSQSGL